MARSLFVAHFPFCQLYQSPAALCCDGLVLLEADVLLQPAKATESAVALSSKAAAVGHLVASTGPGSAACQPVGEPACHLTECWVTALAKLRGQRD